MASLSTHVLDSAGGGPRAGVTVTVTDAGGSTVAASATGPDGRIAPLADGLPPGAYRIAWAGPSGAFLREVAVTVELGEDRHYHVPLLSSPVSGVVYLGA